MALVVRNEPEQLIFALAAVAEAKDQLTGRHPKRVAGTAWRLGRRLGLQESDLVALYRGGLVHDIGKIGVPGAILLKAGPLTAEEERQMREHPGIGERIAKPFAAAADLLCIGRNHHERFDGGGHPGRPSRAKIPVLARLGSL